MGGIRKVDGHLKKQTKEEGGWIGSLLLGSSGFRKIDLQEAFTEGKREKGSFWSKGLGGGWTIQPKFVPLKKKWGDHSQESGRARSLMRGVKR